MPSNDRAAEATDADDRSSNEESVASADESTPASAGASADADAPADPSVPEDFGEVPPDREGSRWGGYALAALLALVFLVGLVRLTAPNVSKLLLATLLSLFGLLVGVTAVWHRLRGS